MDALSPLSSSSRANTRSKPTSLGASPGRGSADKRLKRRQSSATKKQKHARSKHPALKKAQSATDVFDRENGTPTASPLQSPPRGLLREGRSGRLSLGGSTNHSAKRKSIRRTTMSSKVRAVMKIAAATKGTDAARTESTTVLKSPGKRGVSPRAASPRAVTQDTKEQSSTSVRVALRIRPLSPAEEASGDVETLKVDDDGTTVRLVAPAGSAAANNGHKEDSIKFDDVLGPATSQIEAFNKIARPLAEGMLAGKSSVLFAYGVSNSGKSHTTIGSPGAPGMLPQLLSFLFENQHTAGYRVALSILEVHNEAISDLQDPDNCTELRLRDDKNAGVFVENLSRKFARDTKQASLLVNTAMRARRVSDTKMNSASSRGHAVFLVSLVKGNPDTEPEMMFDMEDDVAESGPVGVGIGAGEDEIATFCLVDMAGVERVKKSGVSGTALRESSNINQSLRRVVRVLQTLKANAEPKARKQVVPFRESKLTSLLKPALTGTSGKGSQIVMLMTAYPGAKDFDEKRFVLRAANDARGVTIEYKAVKSRVSCHNTAVTPRRRHSIARASPTPDRSRSPASGRSRATGTDRRRKSMITPGSRRRASSPGMLSDVSALGTPVSTSIGTGSGITPWKNPYGAAEFMDPGLLSCGGFFSPVFGKDKRLSRSQAADVKRSATEGIVKFMAVSIVHNAVSEGMRRVASGQEHHQQFADAACSPIQQLQDPAPAKAGDKSPFAVWAFRESSGLRQQLKEVEEQAKREVKAANRAGEHALALSDKKWSTLLTEKEKEIAELIEAASVGSQEHVQDLQAQLAEQRRAATQARDAIQEATANATAAVTQLARKQLEQTEQQWSARLREMACALSASRSIMNDTVARSLRQQHAARTKLHKAHTTATELSKTINVLQEQRAELGCKVATEKEERKNEAVKAQEHLSRTVEKLKADHKQHEEAIETLWRAKSEGWHRQSQQTIAKAKEDADLALAAAKREFASKSQAMEAEWSRRFEEQEKKFALEKQEHLNTLRRLNQKHETDLEEQANRKDAERLQSVAMAKRGVLAAAEAASKGREAKLHSDIQQARADMEASLRQAQIQQELQLSTERVSAAFEQRQLKETADKLRESLSAHEKESAETIEALQGKLLTAESSAESSKGTVARLSEEVHALKRQKADMESSLKEVRSAMSKELASEQWSKSEAVKKLRSANEKLELELKSEISHRERSITELTEQQRRLTSKHAASKSQCEKLAAMIQELKSKEAAAAATHAEQINELRRQCADASTQAEQDIAQERSIRTQQVAALEVKVRCCEAELVREKAAAAAMLSRAQEDTAASKEAIHRKLVSMETNRDSLKEELTHAQMQMSADMESLQARHDRRVASLEARLRSEVALRMSEETERQEVEQRCRRMKLAHEERLAAERNDALALAKQRDAACDEVQLLKRKIEDATAQKCEVDGHLSAALLRLDEMQKTASTTSASLKGAESTIGELSESLVRRNAQIDRLQRDLKRAEAIEAFSPTKRAQLAETRHAVSQACQERDEAVEAARGAHAEMKKLEQQLQDQKARFQRSMLIERQVLRSQATRLAGARRGVLQTNISPAATTTVVTAEFSTGGSDGKATKGRYAARPTSRTRRSLTGALRGVALSHHREMEGRRVRTVPPEWVKDSTASACKSCDKSFSIFRRRHHCRYCGDIFCASCSDNWTTLPWDAQLDTSRVCGPCDTLLRHAIGEGGEMASE